MSIRGRKLPRITGYDGLIFHSSKESSLRLNRRIWRLLFMVGVWCVIILAFNLVIQRTQRASSQDARRTKENAVILSLARESELFSLKKTLENLHLRFNKKFEYPILIVTDGEPFTERFQQHIRAVFRGSETKVTFSTIEEKHWEIPHWIDRNRLNASLNELKEQNIVHGDEPAYRQMCRWFSGFFMWHKEMLPYDWYWRVEPGVEIDEDPFSLLARNNQIYGFVISLLEIRETVPSLWNVTRLFMNQMRQHYLGQKSLIPFFVTKDYEYNYCHFWDNFEIARLDFFRSQQYQDYFRFLDERGLFFYERTGDAPVHSLAVGMFLRKRDVRFMDHIGYIHPPLQHCPTVDPGKEFVVADEEEDDGFGKCFCDPKKSFDLVWGSCLKRWQKFPAELDELSE